MKSRIYLKLGVLAGVLFTLVASCSAAPNSTTLSESTPTGTIPEASSKTAQYKVEIESLPVKEFKFDDAIRRHREFAKADPRHVLGITEEEEKAFRKMSASDVKGILGLKILTEEMVPLTVPTSSNGSMSVQADNGSIPLNGGGSLLPGDHIVQQRWMVVAWIWHHAIVSRSNVQNPANPWCIQYPTIDSYIDEVSFQQIYQKGVEQNKGMLDDRIFLLLSPLVDLSNNGDARGVAVKRAQARYQLSRVEYTERYDWGENNCEHLVRWCREGKSYSSQPPLNQNDTLSHYFPELSVLHRFTRSSDWNHFYSTWMNEYLMDWRDYYIWEGESNHLKRNSGNGLVPLYRKVRSDWWHPVDTLLTKNPNEANDWQNTGVQGYIAPSYDSNVYHMTRPLYRLARYSDWTHHFTSNRAEYDYLRYNGEWLDEGVLGYTW